MLCILLGMVFGRYAYYMAKIRFRLYESDWYYKYYDRVRLLVFLFIAKAIFPVMLMHFVLMALMFYLFDQSVFAGDFLYTSYLFFFLLVIAYAYFLHRYPQFCFFYHRARQPRVNLDNWFVQQGYQAAESSKDQTCNCVPTDYFIYDTEGQGYVGAYHIFYIHFGSVTEAFLLSGKRVIIKGNSHVLQHLVTKDWFIRLRRNEWVNGAHFRLEVNCWDYLIPKMKYWSLSEEIAERYKMPVEIFFAPSKYLKPKILSHLHQRDSFNTDWSDQYLPFK